MKWKLPPEIKIYEALSALSDERVEVRGEDATVRSARGSSQYAVHYNERLKQIMANDKGSYWQKYLGYPSIAYLMKTGVISYDPIYSAALAGVDWKEIKTKFGEDYEGTKEHINSLLQSKGISIDGFRLEIDNIARQIESLDLSMYGSPALPPAGN